jgi:TetR/AcrR family transcriptional regulator
MLIYEMEQKKSTQKRQQLLAAALDVFSVYGFSGASLDEIAQLAEMHKSNIFYYYENKEALYVEVLTTVMQKWLAPLQVLEAELEPAQAITQYLMQKIEVSRTQPKASKLFALEIIQGAPHMLPILKGPLKKLFKRKAKVISKWQEQGKISDNIDAELLIINLWGITQNYADFSTQIEMVTGKTLRNRSMYERTVQHTVHMMLYGILPRN